jgi:inner membrane protein involved in colicin E2 resistance
MVIVILVIIAVVLWSDKKVDWSGAVKNKIHKDGKAE